MSKQIKTVDNAKRSDGSLSIVECNKKPSSGVFTNNTEAYINEKIDIRIHSLPDLDEINVLDCFSGEGLIWKGVKEKVPQKKINVLGIDINQYKKKINLKGDNLKFLTSIDLTNFHIIDLDSWGVPFKQLEIIFKRNYRGIIHCTFIQVGKGNIHKGLLHRLGYTSKMVDKCPTLFTRNPFSKMLAYLSLCGVNEIHSVSATARKNYFYFIL